MKSKIMLLLIPMSSAWAMTQIDAEYNYGKQIYGTSRENSHIEKGIDVSLAQFFTSFFGIEGSYAKSYDVTTENTVVQVKGYNVDQISHQYRVVLESYSVGIRLALLPPTSFLVPQIAAGYSKQRYTTSEDFTWQDRTSKEKFTYTSPTSKLLNDSYYGAFSLLFKLTSSFSLKASVRTTFPAKEWNSAKNDLKFTGGISWSF